MRRATERLVLIMGAALLAACSPSIKRFDITPQVVCEDGTAVMEWQASGALAISVRPELSTPAAECTAVGRETTAFTLVAQRCGKEALRRVELVELHAGAAEPVVLRTSAIEGGDVVARGDKNVELWGERVEVSSIAACAHRDITVQHAGMSASLPADGAPVSVASTTLSGSWELRSPLSPAEQGDPTLRPKTLAILATVRCKEKPQ